MGLPFALARTCPNADCKWSWQLLFHHLGGDDLMDFVSCWDLQDRFSHILEKGRANLLDGFAVSRTFSTDYVRGSLRLFPMHWTMGLGREAFKKQVSDHLPFVASFRIF